MCSETQCTSKSWSKKIYDISKKKFLKRAYENRNAFNTFLDRKDINTQCVFGNNIY